MFETGHGEACSVNGVSYIDYECNDYMEEWNFENWGVRYWSRTPEFEEYLKRQG